MLQAFYTATVGAQQQMERMGVQGNNMANANTFGFRAEKPAFEALMYRMVDGIDGQQLPKGSGTRMVSTITDFRSAALEETGRKQDYAIVGDGFFALYDPVLVSADKGGRNNGYALLSGGWRGPAGSGHQRLSHCGDGR